MFKIATAVKDILSSRYMPVDCVFTSETEGERLDFRPIEIPYTQSFTISLLLGWKTLEVLFTPGNFAKPLISTMAAANSQKKFFFKSFVRMAKKDGASISFFINGEKRDPFQDDSWPGQWHSFSLCFSKGPLGPDQIAGIHDLALTWSSRMFGCILSLMPIEQITSENLQGETEGRAYEALVKKYERSLLNRAICIEIHGSKCMVCGFDFEKIYGDIGAGFIEIHHLEPVSGLGEDTLIDPETDLVPLCSNCHRMAHRRVPNPFTVEELKRFIKP